VALNGHGKWLGQNRKKRTGGEIVDISSIAAGGPIRRSSGKGREDMKNGLISRVIRVSDPTGRRLAVFSLLAASLLCFSPLLRAQISSARINGTITDTSGAVIPGARVVLTSIQTGVKRYTSTNKDGDYSFVDILPGQFTLEASKTGFKTQRQASFTLSVNQTATYDFTLPV
jgi:hypothetical protein